MPDLTVRMTMPQFRFVTTNAPHPLFVGGYGAGKTHAAVYRACYLKQKYPNLNVAYYLPTYDLVNTIGFPQFAEVMEQLKITGKILKSPMPCVKIGAGMIIFRTMDTPERIIGYEVADSLVDELDTLPTDKARDVWSKIVARNRQKKADGCENTIGVATTPEGFKFVHEMWVANPKPGYEVIKAPTRSNARNLPEGYVDNLRDIYAPQLLEAYIEGEFVNLTSGTVYRDYDRVRCGSNERIKEKEPLFIGQDFNVGQMASVVFVRRQSCLHAVEELTGVYDTPELVKIVKERWQSQGHAIYMYPDASGGSRKTVDASKTDMAILVAAHFSIRAHATNPAVRDRILSVNGAFAHAKVYVNAQACPETARCLEQQAYDRNGEPDKRAGHDHLNDAFGYVCHQEFPVIRLMKLIKIGGML